jgi:epoxyqueuosine reductase QueG
LSEELRGLLRQSNKALDKFIKGTPLSRAGGKGLKRNALIVIGNLRLKGLREEVEAYQTLPYFAELAQWTLRQLDSP